MKNKKMRENLKLISSFESVCLKLPGKLAAELNRKERSDEEMIFFLEIVKRYGTKKDKIVWGILADEKKKKVNKKKIEEEKVSHEQLSEEIGEEKEEDKKKTIRKSVFKKRRRF